MNSVKNRNYVLSQFSCDSAVGDDHHVFNHLFAFALDHLGDVCRHSVFIEVELQLSGIESQRPLHMTSLSDGKACLMKDKKGILDFFG